MLVVNLIVIIKMMRHTPLQFLRHDLKKTKRKKANEVYVNEHVQKGTSFSIVPPLAEGWERNSTGESNEGRTVDA